MRRELGYLGLPPPFGDDVQHRLRGQGPALDFAVAPDSIKLPIMLEVLDEAKQRGIQIVTVPTDEACRLVSTKESEKVRAILHVTC